MRTDHEWSPGSSRAGYRGHVTETLRPTHHMPATSAEDREDGSVAFMAICTCGWRGPDRDDELPADCDRWSHIEGYDQALDGSWISPF